MDTDNTESSDGHSERRTGSSPNINNDKISSLLSSMGGSTNNKNIALLNAITPYMRESRATKINSAIKAIQVINILSSLQ